MMVYKFENLAASNKFRIRPKGWKRSRLNCLAGIRSLKVFSRKHARIITSAKSLRNPRMFVHAGIQIRSSGNCWMNFPESLHPERQKRYALILSTCYRFHSREYYVAWRVHTYTGPKPTHGRKLSISRDNDNPNQTDKSLSSALEFNPWGNAHARRMLRVPPVKKGPKTCRWSWNIFLAIVETVGYTTTEASRWWAFIAV